MSTHSIIDLQHKVKDFCEARDWDQFHNPKDLAIALILETAELLEPFRYLSQEEVKEKLKNKKEYVEEEVADIFFLLLRFSQMHNIDIEKSLLKKMKKIDEKYPVELAKGQNKKYNEY